jgi:hypothetical protein
VIETSTVGSALDIELICACADDLSLTPNFSWVLGCSHTENRFQRFQGDPKTVETVTVVAAHSNTSMNRGVNQSGIVMTQPG